MLTLFAALCHSRTMRPLLWWALALLAYATLPVSPGWVLLLVVGLGVALTVTARRVREATGQALTPRAACGSSLNASPGR
jgi:hypothetical protein